ncbi:hypothetical protein NKJ08_32095, partial [Mesorhizobium sp. M0244]
MSRPAPVLASVAAVRFDADADAKLSALRRTKFVATAALAFCVLVFAVAKSLEGRHAWLGFGGGPPPAPARRGGGGGGVGGARLVRPRRPGPALRGRGGGG